MFFNLTRSIGYGLKTKEIDSYDLFQFGKGDPTKSTTRAYIPSYLNNVPLVIGAGVLPERVPLLGSNSLLDKLGSVIDLPNRAVHFTALPCSVELHVKCGHFAVFILDTNHEHPGHELVWKQLSSPSCWERPHPELVLPPPKPMTDEAKAHEVLNSRPPLPHADSTSAMAGEMEADRVGSRRFPEEHLDLHDGGRAAGHDAERLAPIGSSADFESLPRPGLLRAQGHQEVQQRPWPLREMQSVPEKMEMEHQEGGLGHLVFPRRWLSKFLFSTIAIASAVIEGHTSFGSLSKEDQAQVQGSASGSTTSSSHQGLRADGPYFDAAEWMDELPLGLHRPSIQTTWTSRGATSCSRSWSRSPLCKQNLRRWQSTSSSTRRPTSRSGRSWRCWRIANATSDWPRTRAWIGVWWTTSSTRWSRASTMYRIHEVRSCEKAER